MQDACTVNQTVKYLTKKWTLLIILELYKGEGVYPQVFRAPGCP